jgi:hypothetical protein
MRHFVTANCVFPSPNSVGQPVLVTLNVRENPDPHVWLLSVNAFGDPRRLEQ